MASESAVFVDMEGAPEVETCFQEQEECVDLGTCYATDEELDPQELDPEYVPPQSVPLPTTQEHGHNVAYDNVTFGGNYMTGMDYGQGVQYPAQHMQQGYAASPMQMAHQVYPQMVPTCFMQCGPAMTLLPMMPVSMMPFNMTTQQNQWAPAAMPEQFPSTQASTDQFLRPSTLQERRSDRFQSGSYTPHDLQELRKSLNDDPPRPASPLSTASLSASEADAVQIASSSASTAASERDTPRGLAELQGVTQPLSAAAQAVVAQVRQMLKRAAPGDKAQLNMGEELIKLSKQSEDSARAIQHLIEEYQCVKTRPQSQQLLAAFKRKLSGDLEEFKKMCTDKNSNYVIAKIVQVVPYELILWIVQSLSLMLECTFNGEAEPLKSRWEALARQKQGCRILQRVIEHHGKKQEVQKMVTQGVIQHSKTLCRNEYGRYVLEKAWELAETYPTFETLVNVRDTIAEKTIENVLTTAKDKQASYMLKFMVSRKKSQVPVEEEYLDKKYHVIVNAVTASEEVANSLARDKFAHHLIAQILTQPALFPVQHENLVKFLRKDADELKDHKYPKGKEGQAADQEATEKGPEVNKVYAALQKYL